VIGFGDKQLAARHDFRRVPMFEQLRRVRQMRPDPPAVLDCA
jgi:hypothetical protein